MVFVACLLFCSSMWTFAAVSPEYNLDVHVNVSRMVLHGDSTLHYQYLSATIDGKKYELESIGSYQSLLKLADYKARVVSDDRGKGEYESWRVYEFQFPDGKTRKFLVVGQLE